jgi:hypothetical protein
MALRTLPTVAVSLAALAVAAAVGPRASAAVAQIIAEESSPLVEVAALSRVGVEARRVAAVERPRFPVHCWPRPHSHSLEAQAMEQ